LQTSFGQLLLPALAAILPLFQALATFAQQHSTLFGALVITFTSVAGAVLLYATYLKLLPLRIAAVAAAQAILNFVMTANPLGLYIMAIAALAGAFVLLTGRFEDVYIGLKKVVNGFNSLLNIVLPLDIPMMNVTKRTKEIAQEQYRSIPIAEQIGIKYLEIAGACREILQVPIAKQLATQTDRLTQLAFSLGVTNVTYGKFKTATGGASKAVETAAEKMKKYTDALKQSEVAEKSYTRSQKARADAQKSLNSANTDLTTAQDRFNKAVAGYGADSDEAKAAQKELSQAQRNVEQAGYRVEESVFAVRDAEKKLAELRADPTTSAQAIRQAEIELAQAKLAVKEATEAQEEATNGLADAQYILNEAVNGAVKGSDLYNKLLKEVDEAKERQISASERLTDATDAETEAYERLAEAIKAASDAAVNANKTVELIPKLPTDPTSGGGGTSFGGKSDPSVQIVVNTGIGTNGVEAGRQIVQLLQQYTAVDAFAIDRLGFAPRR
jgi:predicted  nucleic acid-binding Zn-ribbon protein